MENNLKAVVYGRLEAIAAAEKITRVELSAMSRELLLYVPDSQDIDIVNRLLGVLTPFHRRGAILFFGHFLPWEQEKDAKGKFSRFGKKTKSEKSLAKKTDAIKEFLADETNDIWSWLDRNAEVKQKDFSAMIARAIKKALEGDEKSNTPAISADQVLEAVFEGGISLNDVLHSVQPKVEQMQQVANALIPQEQQEEQNAA
jgi:succinate dehydrogenase flavin-adding protein (antitoxin of CptAB toxin-antitoxin module)